MIQMPLIRGEISGYDVDRMAFEFTMLNLGKVVQCQISAAAMDMLAKKRGTLPAERKAQFLQLRETIEHIASDNFDHDTFTVEGDMVRIFAKHIRCEPHPDKHLSGW